MIRQQYSQFGLQPATEWPTTTALDTMRTQRAPNRPRPGARNAYRTA